MVANMWCSTAVAAVLSAAAAADQAISSIRYAAEVRARIRPEVDRWLQSQTNARP